MSNKESENKEVKETKEDKKLNKFEIYCEENPDAKECKIFDV